MNARRRLRQSRADEPQKKPSRRNGGPRRKFTTTLSEHDLTGKCRSLPRVKAREARIGKSLPLTPRQFPISGCYDHLEGIGTDRTGR